MKLKEGAQVAYITRGGQKGQGIVTIEGSQIIMCHNDPNLHDYVPGKTYGLMYALRIGPDPVKSGLLHSFTVIEQGYNDAQIIEKSTSQGTVFRKIYKEFESCGLVFVGAIHKNIDDCAKPSAIVTSMDLQYLKDSGWKPVEKSESAEDQLKKQRKKY